jgi:hypothetical protein
VDLEPFVPLLIIYTCSAMTHIMEDIRLDAIKFLDLWVNIVPEAITGKFWRRVMLTTTAIDYSPDVT